MPYLTKLPPLFVAVLLCGCSLFQPATRPIRLTLPRELFATKGRPSLEAMSHFALLAKGPVSNTLSNDDIGRRSVACTQLEGQILFPLTLDDLKGGLTVSVPPGNYRFSVVGFSGSNVANPASVAQMVTGSSSLTEYLIAQGQINTVGQTLGSLAVAYQDGVTADLFAACPPLSSTLHFAAAGEGTLKFYSFANDLWGSATVYAGTTDSGGLFVDTDKLGHLAYGFGVGQTLKYATSSGSVLNETIVDSAGAVGHGVAIGKKSDGTLTAFANYHVGSGNATAGLYERSGTNWIYASSLLSATLYGYRDHSVAFGANGVAVVSASSTTAPPILTVRYLPSTGIWDAAFQINSINATSCSSGTYAADAKLDADGYAHVVYICEGVNYHLGYATNRSGLWTYSKLTTNSILMRSVAIDIDSTGRRHVMYSAGGDVNYFYADLNEPAFIGPDLLFSTANGDQVFNVLLRAISPTEIHSILNVQYLSSNRKLRHLKNTGGAWNQTLIGTIGDVVTMSNGLWAR